MVTALMLRGRRCALPANGKRWSPRARPGPGGGSTTAGGRRPHPARPPPPRLRARARAASAHAQGWQATTLPGSAARARIDQLLDQGSPGARAPGTGHPAPVDEPRGDQVCSNRTDPIAPIGEQADASTPWTRPAPACDDFEIAMGGGVYRRAMEGRLCGGGPSARQASGPVSCRPARTAPSIYGLVDGSRNGFGSKNRTEPFCRSISRCQRARSARCDSVFAGSESGEATPRRSGWGPGSSKPRPAPCHRLSCHKITSRVYGSGLTVSRTPKPEAS